MMTVVIISHEIGIPRSKGDVFNAMSASASFGVYVLIHTLKSGGRFGKLYCGGKIKVQKKHAGACFFALYLDLIAVRFLSG